MEQHRKSDRMHPHLRRLTTMAVVMVAAWLLGQLLGPVFVKGLFL